MEGVVLTRPALALHVLMRPAAQGRHGHEIGQHHLPADTGEFRLQHIAIMQVALRSRDGPLGGSNLKVAAPLSI